MLVNTRRKKMNDMNDGCHHNRKENDIIEQCVARASQNNIDRY